MRLDPRQLSNGGDKCWLAQLSQLTAIENGPLN